MKVVAIIPIKLNNERLPNKNIKLFSNGKPLCSYIFTTLVTVENIDEIYVYCSDERIKQYLLPKMKFLKRNESLDTNNSTMNDILSSFKTEVDADIYVLAHVTAPFIKKESFYDCIEKVKSKDYDSAFSVAKVQEFLWKDDKPINYELEHIPRTQDLPKIYKETCGFYIFKKEIIEKLNRRIGNKPYLYEVSDIETIDIDDAFDFEIADFLAKKIEEK